MIIATLIAADRLTRDAIYRAGDLLGDAGVSANEWSWIDDGSAADIECRATPFQLPLIRATLEGRLEGIDVVVQPAAGRDKKLLVADMDSTMIGQECIDELADYAGRKAEVAAITERAMLGQVDFADALRERVAALAGLEASAVDRCRLARVHPNPGARTLVMTMRARGALTLLVSGGFTAFAGPVGEDLGFERVAANELAIERGLLSGAVEGAIVDGAAKRAALEAARTELGLDPAAVLAVGDGANDVAMIEAAGLGVAYHAKPALVRVAHARIEHNDLTALLWAQGIARVDWAS